MRTRRLWSSSISDTDDKKAVVGPPLGALPVEMQRVDEVDDLHVPRQQALDQRHRPGLERFRQQRVIRVVEHGRRDLPRELPRHVVHVDQQAHQFGDRDRGMRVVELDRHVVGERRELAVLRLVPAQEVLQRGRREEELLPQPQLVPGRRLVARIEHARDRFEPHAVGQRADVIAAIEVVEPQRIRRPRRPQPQRVDVAPAPAGDRRVVGDRVDGLRRIPDVARLPVLALAAVDGAAEADRVGDLGPLELPRIARRQPVLGELELPAVLQHLAEDAVVVADAVAVGGDRERRHAFHEAGGEPAEAAVAERGVGLELAQPVEIDAEVAQRLARRLGEAEVAERVEQQAPDQEFEREVVDALAAVAVGLAGRVHPAIDDAIAHGERRRHEPVVLLRVPRVLADHVGELVENRASGTRRRFRAGGVSACSVPACGAAGTGSGGAAGMPSRVSAVIGTPPVRGRAPVPTCEEWRGGGSGIRA